MKKKNSEKDLAIQLKEILGVVGFEMINTIVDDILNFLRKRTDNNLIVIEAALDGYVLSLSRILESTIAFQCVCEAFKKFDTSVPPKYYRLFNIPIEQKNTPEKE